MTQKTAGRTSQFLVGKLISRFYQDNLWTTAQRLKEKSAMCRFRHVVHIMDDIKRHEAERLKRQAEAEGEGGSSGGEGCADGPEALQEALEEATHRATALHVEAEVTKSAVLSHLLYI